MKFLQIRKQLKIFTDLKFAISLLIVIALASSLGSFIEQDEPINFYQENYPMNPKVYGFIDYNLILKFGIDHVYRTWWFLFLLVLLGVSLIGCTITRQFPLLKNSKDYYFKAKTKSFDELPFFIKIQNIYYLKESIVLKLQKLNFSIFQRKNGIYAYKGLIGRISPILVHLSLIIILTGASLGAFQNFKAQEILPKGEIFHIQNPLRVGSFTNFPDYGIRVNDFWVEYEQKKIHQFYSNLSILDNYGNELIEQTISVNNPLRYNGVDFYQSDWNLLGIRIEKNNQVYELPLFQLEKNAKSWVTWIEDFPSYYTLLFDQFQNNFAIYNQKGELENIKNIGDSILIKDTKNESYMVSIIDILPSTGLLIKYDPSILFIYFGFGLLMITAALSYLPYTQIWIFNNSKECWIGGDTNRGKVQFEIEFENLIRSIESNIKITKQKKLF
jgi:cytochrome c biogenesis protein